MSIYAVLSDRRARSRCRLRGAGARPGRDLQGHRCRQLRTGGDGDVGCVRLRRDAQDRRCRVHRRSCASSRTRRAAAVVAGILSSALIGALAHVLVFHPLRRAPALAKVVASLGLLVTLQALVSIRFGSTPRSVQPVLPSGTVPLGDLVFPVDRIHLTGDRRAAGGRGLGGAAVHATRHRVACRGRGRALGRTARVLAAAPRRRELDRRVGDRRSGGDPRRRGDDARSRRVRVVRRAGAGGGVARAALVGRAWRSAPGWRSAPCSPQLTYLSTKPWWPGWAAAGLNDVVPLLVVIVALFVLGKNLPTRASAAAPRLPAVFVPRWRPGCRRDRRSSPPSRRSS